MQVNPFLFFFFGIDVVYRQFSFYVTNKANTILIKNVFIQFLEKNQTKMLYN